VGHRQSKKENTTMIAELIGTLVKPALRSAAATTLRTHERTRHFDYVTLADGTILTMPRESGGGQGGTGGAEGGGAAAGEPASDGRPAAVVRLADGRTRARDGAAAGPRGSGNVPSAHVHCAAGHVALAAGPYGG
jgi:hypothetical protein